MTGIPPTSDRDAAIAWCLRLREGDMLPHAAEALELWLAGNEERRDHLDAALAVWDAVEQEADAPELLALRREALGAIHRAGKRRWVHAGWGRRPLQAAVAAVALLSVSLGTVLWRGQDGEQYRTGIGERRVIVLADGSRLSLDADSQASVAFTSQRRTIVLDRGRARFKVAKDPLRPFAVHSGGSVVVATGTEFSVERLAREVRVALFEGRIAVLRDTDRGRSSEMVRRDGHIVTAERVLTPGLELRMPTVGNVGAVRPAAASEGMEDGQISFERETLAVAAERMNRYAAGRRLDIAPSAVNIRVSGIFNVGDNEAFAQAVAATFPVRVASDRDTITITGVHSPI
ncbi:FecR domain-containing protein [Sphingomonas sp. CARO-RG-8B-R24-01]|uniref:FecR family protein n=1 Tax=Sphingomonas sp. CARO-RG-8B-R24-01 TaxID=2914831 RepID=UPI001F5683CC|nr:FecR domain-containing protein [Sphingomonas sp. CARO-RG-8B-R24-01]